MNPKPRKPLSPIYFLSVFFVFLWFLLSLSLPLSAQTESTWGEAIILGQAEQTHAPTLQIYNDRVVATWVASEPDSEYQYMRTFVDSDNILTEIQRLPLPPVYPYAQQLAPAQDHSSHFFWLDEAHNEPESGTRLWSALFSPQMVMERGPIRITEPIVYHYTLASDAENGVWLVWSTDNIAEPNLYTQYVDAAGRPNQQAIFLTTGDWPQLKTTQEDEFLLFWLDRNRLYRGEFSGNLLETASPLTTDIRLERGDRRLNFEVTLDQTYGYAFWTIARPSGEVETWWSSGEIDSLTWTSPSRLSIGEGNEVLSWVSPIHGRSNDLIATAQSGNTLGLLYFQDGDIHRYEELITLDGIGLLGMPALHSDSDGHLFLAWSQPTEAGYADLKLITNR